MRSWSDLTVRERARLAMGKARRFYLVHFRPGYVARSIARRSGDCARSGACCRLLFTCPILAVEPLPSCRINARKPKVCKAFPIDERDLADRDIISPHVPCGFSFRPLMPSSPKGLPKDLE